MSRRLVITSFVQIIGKLWMPQCDAATEKVLSAYDIENMRDEDTGGFTRESVEQWVMVNSGDFSSVTDFRAEIEDGPKTYRFDWADEDSELIYNDCMYPEPEDA